MATVVPVLSTPAEHIFEDLTPAVPVPESRLSEEQLYLQYEIKRTVSEIREGRWKRIALQFPDEMLVDAPRVYERLSEGLTGARVRRDRNASQMEEVANGLEHVSLNDGEKQQHEASTEQTATDRPTNPEAVEEKLTILADTSYGACCVDEIAAEHVDADVVVHYGRSCLSPTARLPVIYVFTSKPLDLDAAVASFKQIYPEPEEKVCLMADIPFHHHVPALAERLQHEGYTHVFATDIVRNPSSLLPNRTLPSEVLEDPEMLKQYSVFHVSDPPTSLLLILSSRVKQVHIFPTNTLSPTALQASTTALLRRRYALCTRLATVSIFGILINTLSVSNYMAALQHCQSLISKAGKKSYVFVVGKVNAAKIANFAEIGGWVVIGCWESSLVESKEFYRPVITPFELEVALTEDKNRVWGSEWVGNFEELLGKEAKEVSVADAEAGGEAQVDASGSNDAADGDWDDQPSDDEPPEFDLRTGRYISHSRPMGRPKPAISAAASDAATTNGKSSSAPPSSALVQRAKGDVAAMNGAVSPAAEFLRSKRTWQGLGSDYEIAYERDADGRIRGAGIEEGRRGVAKGYTVGQQSSSRS